MQTYEWKLEDCLDTPEMVVEYLNQVIEDGDQDELLRAVGYVMRSEGMSAIARRAGVSREALYASFKEGGNPTLSTLRNVLLACGIELRFSLPASDPPSGIQITSVWRTGKGAWKVATPRRVTQLTKVV